MQINHRACDLFKAIAGALAGRGNLSGGVNLTDEDVGIERFYTSISDEEYPEVVEEDIHYLTDKDWLRYGPSPVSSAFACIYIGEVGTKEFKKYLEFLHNFNLEYPN